MSFTENNRFTFENNTNFEGNNNANNDDTSIDRNRTIKNSIPPMPINQTNTNNLENQQESILSLPIPPPPPPPSSHTPLNRSTMLTPSSSSIDSSGIMEHSEFSQMRRDGYESPSKAAFLQNYPASTTSSTSSLSSSLSSPIKKRLSNNHNNINNWNHQKPQLSTQKKTPLQKINEDLHDLPSGPPLSNQTTTRQDIKTDYALNNNNNNNNNNNDLEKSIMNLTPLNDTTNTYNDIELPPGITMRDYEEDAEMRRISALVKKQWKDSTTKRPLTNSNLERRLLDFRFAQKRRRDKYGNSKPWGIMGLYDHLVGIRVDVEWAEDAAYRREHKLPYFSWADFDEVKDSGLNKPFLTYIILIICTITLIVSFAKNGWQMEPLSINPMIGPSAQTLVDMGAKKTELIVMDGEWYRIFTPMFLHAGVIHYFFNMLALWFIGSAVELSHGFIAAAILFVIPATGGTILSAIFLPQYISVGASGGIFGLIGACVADIMMNWSLLFSSEVNNTTTTTTSNENIQRQQTQYHDPYNQYQIQQQQAQDQSLNQTTARHIKVVIFLIFDIALNCIIGLTPLVDNFTHLGGGVYGFLCGMSTMELLSSGFFGKHYGSKGRLKKIFIKFFGLIVSVTAIMITTIVLAESDGYTSPCGVCRYFSCIPFPPWSEVEDRLWHCDDCNLVRADATKDPMKGIFDELQIFCPDGDMEYVDISDQYITDTSQLSRDLPDYCRSSCDSVYFP